VDTIDIDHTLLADFAAVQSHPTAVGTNTVITFDVNDTITLVNVAPASLHASDFHFL
jgi:serralysin